MTLVGLMAAVLAPMPIAAAQPVPLVEEDFTGASAIPEFIAVGTACLTGAPAAQPPAGSHPLTGCPADSAGPVPPTGGAPYGYLQLTSAGNNQAGAALYNEPIRADQGIDVTFEQWQYGGTTPPADGISFFLIDGSATLTAPGAFGGSLGYAQKLPDDLPGNPFQPGVNQGYVGVGLDVLGNFFGDWEQRGLGCAERSPAGTGFRDPAPGPNMVTVRGPGNGTQGYCFLTATATGLDTGGPWTSTLPGRLHGPTTTLPGDVTPEDAERLLAPSRRTVNVRITPAPDPVLTVTIDFNNGAGPQQVLTTPAPTPVPDTYKFGFAASTGMYTDVHLVRNVVVRPVAELPALSLDKRLATGTTVPDPAPVGTVVRYEYVVTNTGNMDITGLTVTDDVVPMIACRQDTLAVGASIVCTGSHTITEEDAARGSVTNTAEARGTAESHNVESPEAQVTVRAGGGGGTLKLVKKVDASHPYRPGDRVTYRYLVRNDSTRTVTGLRIDDSHITGVTCRETTLAPGASTVCTGTYVIPAVPPGPAPKCRHHHHCHRAITNTARASAGGLTSAQARATIKVAAKPRHCHPGKGKASGCAPAPA